MNHKEVHKRVDEYLKNTLADNFGYHPIILAFRGSYAHGTYVKDFIDDIDVIGAGWYNVDYYLGNRTFSKGVTETSGEELDIVYYEIRKFIHLLLGGNPNVISMLWLNPEYYLYINPEWEWIVKERELFLSKRILKGLMGYASNQIERMEKHKFEGYMSGKRKALVEKFGYDPKMFAHSVRLLRMGQEFAVSGELYPDRRGRDAEELTEIKQGKYTFEQAKSMGEDLFYQLKSLNILCEIPDKPAISEVNKKMIKSFLATNLFQK